MFSKVLSSALMGIDGYIVNVEVDLSEGLPSFDLVGLPDSAVRESKERVKAAIKNTNINFPIKRITVNLAPADIRKEGPLFDLPIAIGILSCLGIIPKKKLDKTMFVGELSLDGTIRSVNGILPMTYCTYKHGLKECIIPKTNSKEAAVIKGVSVIGVNNLREVIDYLNNKIHIEATVMDVINTLNSNNIPVEYDFSDVKGQDNVKRALEIAASGYHNVIMIGPPGSGKTMMAKRLSGIMPDLTLEESIEITKIYSIAGKLRDNTSLVTKRPFRSPHHTVSPSALTGGGKIPKPGEVSLAHYGVLFLDELTEFSKTALEVLRQPLEDGKVTISRVNATLTYPSDFMLIASLNPCPCGFYPDAEKCSCTPLQIKRYLNKISGPLLDRMDIHVEATAVQYEDLNKEYKTESSKDIKTRVKFAQQIQQERYKNENILFNSQLTPSQIHIYCKLGNKEKKILELAFKKMNLSARAYHRILKVARTIADLDNSENICISHLTEAIQYRNLDRKYWG